MAAGPAPRECREVAAVIGGGMRECQPGR